MRLLLLSTLAGLVAAKVCAPAGCIEGAASSALLATDFSSGTFLTPGVHHFKSSPASVLNLSISSTSDSVTILPPSHPVTFPLAIYAGEPTPQGLNSSSSDWESLYLPLGWYAVVGGQVGQAIRGVVSSRSELPAGSWKITGFGSDLCTPPCSHGTCTPSLDNSNATCACAPGWDGVACDACAPGFWGPSCKPCGNNGAFCDDSLAGTGKSLRPQDSEVGCDCVHGLCGSNGECACSSGWITNPKVSGQKCNACASGFFKDMDNSCRACPAGCTQCTLQEGTSSTPACTACLDELELSTSVPPMCQSVVACPIGQYFDKVAIKCLPCSPACTACTGPKTSDCITCAAPRMWFRDRCVGYAHDSGLCDNAFSRLPGTFIVNNDKQVCDSCPVGCNRCHIPGWNIASSFTGLVCLSCQDGYLLQDGKCVRECREGTFWPPTWVATGTCEACEKTCRTCAGTSSFCTSCPSTPVYNGTCIDSCPENTFLVKGKCESCHPDCLTCSSPNSAIACLSCPASRPILSERRCVPFCPASSWFHKLTSSCRPCSANCVSCLSWESCTSCSEGYTLKGGSCVPASCDGPYGAGLGVCLSAFLPPKEKSTASGSKRKPLIWLIGLGAPLVVLALLAILYVRRERRRTRAATAEFARQIDETGIRKRLARLFGYPQEEDEERPRLRELVLGPRASPARGRDRPVSAHSLAPMPAAPTLPDIGAKGKEKGQEKSSFDEESWIAPPPAYAPTGMSATSTHMALPSGLLLPPRPIAAPSVTREETGHTVRAGTNGVPLSPGAVRKLSELWPPLGRRYDHGVI